MRSDRRVRGGSGCVVERVRAKYNGFEVQCRQGRATLRTGIFSARANQPAIPARIEAVGNFSIATVQYEPGEPIHPTPANVSRNSPYGGPL